VELGNRSYAKSSSESIAKNRSEHLMNVTAKLGIG
jgi:hypothetical protein